MSLLTFIGRLLLKTREKSVSKFIENPLLHQKKTLKDLINQGASSDYGKKYSLDKIRTYEEFSEQIPVVNYEEFFPQIDKVLHGEKNIIWTGPIKWFAKS